MWARKIIFGFRGPTSEIMEVSLGNLKLKVKLQKSANRPFGVQNMQKVQQRSLLPMKNILFN